MLDRENSVNYNHSRNVIQEVFPEEACRGGRQTRSTVTKVGNDQRNHTLNLK